MSLPRPVTADLFDVEYKPSQTAIDHIADIIENHGFSVHRIDNFDIKLWFKFTMNGTGLDGTLIIDRMSRTYEITAKDEQQYPILATGDFQIVKDYLELLKESIKWPAKQLNG